MFDSVNDAANGLEYIEALSAEELKQTLKSITLPMRIVAIYSQGSKHFAWIQTTAKIKKVKAK